ncbi:MAG: hypothetical protein ACRDA3_00490 [Peptostreptococcaceae bacterium]
MAIPCASQPLNVTFTGGIKINYPMPFNETTIKYLTGVIEDFPTNMLGLAINTENIKLTLTEKVEELIPPITIPMDCNPNGFVEVSNVTVNRVAVHGSMNFVVSANLFKDNSISIPSSVSLAWPSADGTEYIPEHLLAYADSITDTYTLDISVTKLALKSVDAVVDSNLYTFKVSGELEIKAVKI